MEYIDAACVKNKMLEQFPNLGFMLITVRKQALAEKVINMIEAKLVDKTTQAFISLLKNNRKTLKKERYSVWVGGNPVLWCVVDDLRRNTYYTWEFSSYACPTNGYVTFIFTKI